MGGRGGGVVSGVLREPFEQPSEPTSRHGRTFWFCLAIGAGCMAFGLISLFSRAAATDPPNFAVFFIGLALVHDLVLAPVVIGAAWLLRGVLPRRVRGLLYGALAVSAIVAGYSIPFVAGWGIQPDNPSFLPRDYGFGLLVVLAWVWITAVAIGLARVWVGRGGRR
jgi:hypothetical protein